MLVGTLDQAQRLGERTNYSRAVVPTVAQRVQLLVVAAVPVPEQRRQYSVRSVRPAMRSQQVPKQSFLRDVTQKQANIRWRQQRTLLGPAETSAINGATHDRLLLTTRGPQLYKNQVPVRDVSVFCVTSR